MFPVFWDVTQRRSEVIDVSAQPMFPDLWDVTQRRLEVTEVSVQPMFPFFKGESFSIA